MHPAGIPGSLMVKLKIPTNSAVFLKTIHSHIVLLTGGDIKIRTNREDCKRTPKFSISTMKLSLL